MHALSLPTWWIHITSVLEWVLAIAAVEAYGRRRGEGGWRWLALAMVPALVSAMAACTWHLFDNAAELRGLVVFQAAFTTVGNGAVALAAWNLLRQQRRRGEPSGTPAVHSGGRPSGGLPSGAVRPLAVEAPALPNP